MISLDDGRLMATFCLKGMPFESESESTLNHAFNIVKSFLNQLAKLHGSNLGVWTHIVKRKDKLDSHYQFDSEFMKSFSDKYLLSFSGQQFFKTEYYITFIFKYTKDLSVSISEFEDLLKIGKSVLKRFNCSILRLNDDGSRCENIEFLSYLLNNQQRRYPLTSGKVVNIIGHSDWHFGYDLLEIRNADNQRSRYATFFELDSFSLTTHLGMWDFVLAQQCEFVLTQSMILMKSTAAIKIIDKQANLVASGDNAEHELQELSDARDYVATNEISFGDYHCSLAVFGDSQESVIQDGADLSGEFMARGTLLKRANLKSQFSFLSMLPASTARVMPSPRTTTNLACTWSLHNYSEGKPKGNPIGDGSALIPLKTTSDTLFYLNCHASDINKNVRGQKFAGHTLLLGASGSGKTTLEGTIAGFLTRFNPQMFTIDYNRSTELFMRAYGAEYFTIREGVDTGLNPFQLNDTPELRSFLNRLVYRLSSNNEGVLTEAEEQEVKKGIDTVMRLDLEKRCFSMLLQSIQQPNLRARLGKWCRSVGGQLSWCLDSPVNKFNPANMDRIGFDSTMLLEPDMGGKCHPASEPILGTLFYLKGLMQREGRLLLTVVEEFWMPANYPLTQAFMKRILKAGRLKNEFMLLSSQSPEDAINCDIFAAIVQQTATKIFFPNPDAEFESYQKCNVTKGEFHKLKALDKASRTFLVKQSNTSCFAKLDLFGFDDYLPIISGTDEDIIACERIRTKYGDNPDVWIPRLQDFVRKRLSGKGD
ncbi:conjugal transfer protein TraE [Candidatus Enterovibrio escicola]|uniref:VirB4 family type IV secretion/conjugal transfer ATPase n=1 Tax=Candidatus Enterovibrio escicola TaxID=1927127 RepID=UPI00167FFA2E|nr:conjugal transfer protein TraE [Candidatus Enterovibrio escacola]